MSQLFNSEAALQTNGVTKNDVKEVTEKEFENGPKHKDDERTRMTQMIILTLFRIGGWGAKRPPTSFFPVTSTNVGIRPQNFLTFSFSPFDRLV